MKQSQVVNEGAALQAWLRQVPGPRQVVVEASGFWPAFARAVAPEADRLVMVHPQRVKAIASARLKLEAMAKIGARAKWLETVPGIGPYSAMLILSEVGEIGRFESKRALASYAGLTPGVRESAGKRGKGSTGHHGSSLLRWIMLQVAQVAARNSPAARAWMGRLKKRKPVQVAKIALAHKLSSAVWALLRHGVCFEEDVFARTHSVQGDGDDQRVSNRCLRRLQGDPASSFLLCPPAASAGHPQMERQESTNPPCVPRARIEDCPQFICKHRWTSVPFFIEE